MAKVSGLDKLDVCLRTHLKVLIKRLEFSELY